MQTSLYWQNAGQWLPKDEVEGQEGLGGGKETCCTLDVFIILIAVKAS